MSRRMAMRSLGMTLGIVLQLIATVHGLAAEPTPTPLGGDPRSPGEGPGFVGEPLLAIAAVVAIALLAVVATTLWVRATAHRSTPKPNDRPRPR